VVPIAAQKETDSAQKKRSGENRSFSVAKRPVQKGHGALAVTAPVAAAKARAVELPALAIAGIAVSVTIAVAIAVVRLVIITAIKEGCC
jgi:hypothetical protein